MADKYDAMIDGVGTAAPAAQRDKYDDLIDSVAPPAKESGLVDRFALGLGQQPDVNNGRLDLGDAAYFLGREGPPMVGAALGAPGGPAGMALGAAAGRTAQKALAEGLDYFQPGFKRQESIGEAIRDIGTTGALQGAAGVVGEMASMIRPGSRVAAQALRAGPGIPERYGAAAIEDLSLLGRAPSESQVGKLYEDFHTASGTQPRKAMIEGSADPFDTVQRAKDDMMAAYQKMKDGTMTIQDAVTASQAGRKIKDAARTGNEFALDVYGSANKLKGQFDAFIEKTHPEWGAARTAAFEQKVAEQFQSWLPLNKNTSPNVLRTYTAGAAAAAGAASGAYGALGIPFLISPRTAGYGLRAAYRVGQAAPVARTAAAGALQDHYMGVR